MTRKLKALPHGQIPVIRDAATGALVRNCTHFSQSLITSNQFSTKRPKSVNKEISHCFAPRLSSGYIIRLFRLKELRIDRNRVFFVTGAPPRKLKYGKPRLGESTST